MSAWSSFDTYLSLGITGYSTVKMFLNLRSFDSMSLQVAVTPMISTVRVTFPGVNIPDELVKKVCDAVAEAVADYWASKTNQQSLSNLPPGSLALPPNVGLVDQARQAIQSAAPRTGITPIPPTKSVA